MGPVTAQTGQDCVERGKLKLGNPTTASRNPLHTWILADFNALPSSAFLPAFSSNVDFLSTVACICTQPASTAFGLTPVICIRSPQLLHLRDRGTRSGPPHERLLEVLSSVAAAGFPPYSAGLGKFPIPRNRPLPPPKAPSKSTSNPHPGHSQRHQKSYSLPPPSHVGLHHCPVWRWRASITKATTDSPIPLLQLSRCLGRHRKSCCPPPPRTPDAVHNTADRTAHHRSPHKPHTAGTGPHRAARVWPTGLRSTARQANSSLTVPFGRGARKIWGTSSWTRSCCPLPAPARRNSVSPSRRSSDSASRAILARI